MERIFAVWKPKGMTSHDVVDMVRKATRQRKVGHAGTLDPLASGVLVIGVGRAATKRLASITDTRKEYLAKIKFGAVSNTDDAEGVKTAVEVKSRPDYGMVAKALKQFSGYIDQVPPVYSAVKVKGKPAYRRIRAGEKVELKSRRVLIAGVEIIKYEWPYLDLRVITGPGVYIRALARDIGEELKIGGYLADLERTGVGEFTKENSIALDKLENIRYSETIGKY